MTGQKDFTLKWTTNLLFVVFLYTVIFIKGEFDAFRKLSIHSRGRACP